MRYYNYYKHLAGVSTESSQLGWNVQLWIGPCYQRSDTATFYEYS